MLYLFLILNILNVLGENIPIKVVEEPSNYGIGLQSSSYFMHTLIPKAKPSVFEGPPQFKELVGKCFNYTTDKYNYEFCPFKNVTQKEVSSNWNSYHGILGIWESWVISNYSFTGLKYDSGDACGINMDRSVEIEFTCGNENRLEKVLEPAKCQYKAAFKTPLSCNKDSLLVYPYLSPSIRQEWDMLYSQFRAKWITQKGYKKGINHLYHKSGFINTHQPVPILENSKTDSKAALNFSSNFIQLTECNNNYKQLANEVESLKKQLDNFKKILDLKNLMKSYVLAPSMAEFQPQKTKEVSVAKPFS